MQTIDFIDLGLRNFRDVWQIQKEFVARKKSAGENDAVLFCEHNKVVTFGRSGSRENLLLSCQELKERSIDFAVVDRGGDVTFHCPGQLVAYPIIDLKKIRRDIRFYLRSLEHVVINTLSAYNLSACASENFRGVWINGRKICSIGIGISNWITYHGIALNINNDLSLFNIIKPCGLKSDIMISLSEVLKCPVDFNEVKKKLKDNFCKIFKNDVI